MAGHNDTFTDLYTPERYCIIGAGAAGLAAAKNLKALGIPFDVFEREDDIGGVWYYGKPTSAAYASTHFISSKTMSGYLDYPMPAHYPDYPHQAQILAYLRDYAEKFDLYPLIQFNTSVKHIAPASDTPDESYDVTIQSMAREKTRRYRGVVIANGHHSEPIMPSYPGAFDGVAMHSKQYKTPDVLRGKRVLVVGAGNSGCDIAVEAVGHAAKVYHSTRRGYHYLPKYVFGVPTDVFNDALRGRLPAPPFIRRAMQRLVVQAILGNPARFGLPKPDHRVLEAHPIVNSQMLYALGHGDITPRPDIKMLDGDRVQFIDGTQEAIDVIIYATGFTITFPFIDKALMHWQEGDPGPRLFMHAFHPTRDNLFVIGLLQPDSGIFWLMDYQAQLMAQFIHAQANDPAKAEAFRRMKRGVGPNIRGGTGRVASQRHWLEVDHLLYKRHIRRMIGQLISRG